MTAAEVISAGLSYYSSAGNASIVSDRRTRQRAHFFLTKVCNRIDNAAPHWWRDGDGVVALTQGIGTLPADFANFGDKARVFIQGQLFRELRWRRPDYVKAAIKNNPQQGTPEIYTLDGRTSLGLPKLICWPTDNSVLEIKTYLKRMPELVDAPLQPRVAVTAIAGNPNGTYSYKLTNVTAAGETEGGDVSATVVTAGAFQINLTAIPTFWGRTVTSRKVYRPVTLGLQYKLVGTIGDNLATTFTDNVLDGSLGVNIPTPDIAITGMEYLPEAFHDSAVFDGLVYLLSRSQGDGRAIEFDAKWEVSIRRMWEEYRQGRNTVQAFPAFPGFTRQGIWDRWTPPN